MNETSPRKFFEIEPRVYTMRVTGVSFRLPAIQKISCGSIAIWVMPEPENSHDPNAQAVWFNEEQIGYLPREFAAYLAEEQLTVARVTVVEASKNMQDETVGVGIKVETV